MHLKKTFNFSSSASVRQMRAEFSFAWRLSVYNLEILHTMLVMMVVVLMMMVVVVKMMVMVVVMVMMVVMVMESSYALLQQLFPHLLPGFHLNFHFLRFSRMK